MPGAWCRRGLASQGSVKANRVGFRVSSVVPLSLRVSTNADPARTRAVMNDSERTQKHRISTQDQNLGNHCSTSQRFKMHTNDLDIWLKCRVGLRSSGVGLQSLPFWEFLRWYSWGLDPSVKSKELIQSSPIRWGEKPREAKQLACWWSPGLFNKSDDFPNSGYHSLLFLWLPLCCPLRGKNPKAKQESIKIFGTMRWYKGLVRRATKSYGSGALQLNLKAITNPSMPRCCEACKQGSGRL